MSPLQRDTREHISYDLALQICKPNVDTGRTFTELTSWKANHQRRKSFWNCQYELREQLMILERKLSKSSRCASLDNFKIKFNQSMALEIKQHLFRYREEGNLPTFDKVIAHQGILCWKNEDGIYETKIFLTWNPLILAYHLVRRFHNLKYE